MTKEQDVLYGFGRNLGCHHEVTSFHKVFLANVSTNTQSGASEYEIYFNYMMINHSDKIKIRKLKMRNVGSLKNLNSNHDYVSYHWHSRRRKFG